jgi:DNA (cytosine-5)-methyltransferase 1
MRELALFAGAGGGLLASRLLGWRTVCAVEIEPYCQRLLAQRQADGCLEPFPIWDDIRTFDGRPWRGYVDIVSGGFPCQAFSTAAHGKNNAPDLWPEMLRVISEAQPARVFAENVQCEPIIAAANDLHALGYACAYLPLSAAALGAPHNRSRYWLAAHANARSEPRCPVNVEASFAPAIAGLEWWQNDALAMGIHDGLARRLDRLKAIGNGQVPIVAALAWEVLSGCLSAD